METQRKIQSNSSLVVLALVFAWAIYGRTEVLHVPAVYTNIQAAVYAATSGDEIRIAAGVYTEQVVITNKNLTLTASPGAVLRAAPNMALSFAAYGSTRVPLLGIAMADVVVSGLTLEGEGLGDGQPGSLVGIYFLGASGRVEGCRIFGFRGPHFILSGAPRWPAGILVINPVDLGTGVENVQVSGSTFADNGISIWLVGDIGDNFDPTVLRTTFQVNDNTIVGNGPQVDGRQWGIFIYAGAGGEVKRNIISDHSYVGTNDPVAYSFGLNAVDNVDFPQLPLAALQPVRYEGNTFRNNQIHLLFVRGDDSTVADNSFEGSAPGPRPGGLAISGDNVLVASNRFSDMPLGVLLFGNDPEFGTYLGIASNATLIANGFCNVDTNIVVEQYATHTEQGTLICPPPRLEIRAVQLSWPYSYTGYSLETAPSPGGPWTPSQAVTFPFNDENRAIMPMDQGQQFFRLHRP